MIKVYIRYNHGNPVIGMRTLRSDQNSSNVLRLLARAIKRGEASTDGVSFSNKELNLEVMTNVAH